VKDLRSWCRLGIFGQPGSTWEGLVIKRRDSLYTPRLSRDWLKLRHKWWRKGEYAHTPLGAP
jgi:ATP-dependent DNA ligase